MPSKKVKNINKNPDKKTPLLVCINTDRETPLWSFDNVDNDGEYRFSVDTVDTALVIDKILSLSKLTWAEIKTATHDKGKSKNHELDFLGISNNGKERIKAKGLTDDVDALFSIALTNKIRLIGLKENRVFHVIWYDTAHNFYTSEK